MPILHLSVSRPLMTAIRTAAGDGRIDDWVRTALAARLAVLRQTAEAAPKGGRAYVEAHSPAERSARARMAAEARWSRRTNR